MFKKKFLKRKDELRKRTNTNKIQTFSLKVSLSENENLNENFKALKENSPHEKQVHKLKTQNNSLLFWKWKH